MKRADELTRAYVAHARAIGTPARDLELVRALAERAGWGARDITAPLLPSGISHGVPWELSLAIGSPELRVFVEAQCDPPSPDGYRRAADAVTALAAEHGAHVDRLRAMTEGLPTALPRPARVWHAIALPPTGAPRWHAYVTCPDTRAALAILQRTGVDASIPLRPDDRITIVSLDLVDRARVKAYVLMPNATPAELAVHSPDAYDFARAMQAGDRAWWLVAVGLGADPACALHWPARQLDRETMRARTRALVSPGPWEGLGELHYVSFQRRAGAPRVTIYFEPSVRR